MVGAVGIGGKVAPRIREWQTNRPRISARVVDVHLVRWIGRDSATAHHIHVTVEGKPSRLARGTRYRRDGAGGVSRRVEAEGVSSVDHRASGVIRGASHVDDATYGGCRCIHDPLRRVHHLGPLGAYRTIGVELPYLVGGGYVDVEPAQNIHLVARLGEPTRQDCACGVPGPVVCAGERGHRVGNRVIEEHAGCGRGLPSCRTAYAVDFRRSAEIEHAASHVVHRVIGQRHTHLSPGVGPR